MASITLAASNFSGVKISNTSVKRFPPRVAAVNGARAEAAAAAGEERAEKRESSSRRNVLFAAAAAAVCSAASVAVAGEPKRGSAEAKRIYAPVCVTMPTARICRN